MCLPVCMCLSVYLPISLSVSLSFCLFLLFFASIWKYKNLEKMIRLTGKKKTLFFGFYKVLQYQYVTRKIKDKKLSAELLCTQINSWFITALILSFTQSLICNISFLCFQEKVLCFDTFFHFMFLASEKDFLKSQKLVRRSFFFVCLYVRSLTF